MRGCVAEEMPCWVNRKEMYRFLNIVYYLIEARTTSIPLGRALGRLFKIFGLKDGRLLEGGRLIQGGAY